MAISPPSDILLDAARAADPAQVRDATARLARLASDPAAVNEGFSKALSAAQTAKETLPNGSVKGLPAAAFNGPVFRDDAHAKTSVYQKFEASLLKDFVETMLPKDDESFGDKATAGVYRSMMAEQLANQIAAAGGIGIAKAVEKAHPSEKTHHSPEAKAS